MLNYIKSEIYRNIHTRGNYIFLFSCMAFAIFLNVALGMFGNAHSDFQWANTEYSFSSFYTWMGVIMIMCLPLVSIICGQEFKNNTLKNSIAYGISRSQIYFGKFLMELIICMINLVLISSAYVISGYLMLEDSGIIYFNELLRAITACIPLFLVSMVLIHSLYFICKSEGNANLYWVIIMIVIPRLMALAGKKIDILKTMASWMPLNIVDYSKYDEINDRLIMSWSTQEGFIKCFIIGIVGVAIFYSIGLILFKKREIR